MPSEENVRQYVNWHCIHHLSNKMYHDWVLSEQGKENAVSRVLFVCFVQSCVCVVTRVLCRGGPGTW